MPGGSLFKDYTIHDGIGRVRDTALSIPFMASAISASHVEMFFGRGNFGKHEKCKSNSLKLQQNITQSQNKRAISDIRPRSGDTFRSYSRTSSQRMELFSLQDAMNVQKP